MQRNCEKCGKPYTAKRNTSRYCSTRCRTATSRAGGAAKAATASPAAVSVTEADILPPLVAAIAQELDAAGRLNTAKGQLALQLAMDLSSAGAFDNLSQRAAATREIRASLEAALAGARPSADALDELEKRRREKAARA